MNAWSSTQFSPRWVSRRKSPPYSQNPNKNNSVSSVIHRILNFFNMKYRIDAYKNGTVKQGAKLLSDINEAIKLAKAVASHYHCITMIARVQA